ncbi:uncharacterized protein GLRG_11927 [Colletotrichum graminicola M1.001]|uniref:Secreted protein n=1 Tax=Colletotrichum graminicola (strain M1.001 / M2 / FGSC 10212) TaxID=645133 RepID=E3R0Z1_COLGM|nr:uncharacterized protein GLRG_11927 [Colletotrichum graminicola M1.001]EFQ36779.1 hypothetical protein GLRG_11927 [Colletotrichum graminicola M1.001]
MLKHSILFSAIAGAAVIAGPVMALAMPSVGESVKAPEDVQRRVETSVDMEDACQREYGSDWEAILNGSGCNDWACVNTTSRQQLGLNVNLYCYETLGVTSSASCSSGAWSWRCESY